MYRAFALCFGGCVSLQSVHIVFVRRMLKILDAAAELL